MPPAENHPHPAQADRAIETIYTTVEAQPDRTDWLTVVSNLRQINRQLVEEIARLEQSLASTRQQLHDRQEANQIHEITILQQQDELKIAQERVGTFFQQLETSHQIGQRQQTLIETLSQQLEIFQTIVPQIEAENEELHHKYQQQSQKLIKTEQVAIELHRRLKLQGTSAGKLTANSTETISDDLMPRIEQTANFSGDRASTALSRDSDNLDRDLAVSDLQHSATSQLSTAQIEPAPPLTPIQLEPQEANSGSAPSFLAQITLSPAQPSERSGWREASWQEIDLATNNNQRSRPAPDLLVNANPSPLETVSKESTAIDDLTITKTATPNWPSPTVDRRDGGDGKPERPVAKAVKIDLPKFPKRSAD